ncbi:hypothetical protein R6Q57_002658 [Mikania cordata]
MHPLFAVSLCLCPDPSAIRIEGICGRLVEFCMISLPFDEVILKVRRELLKLNMVNQEGGGLREPILNVYKDVNFDRLVRSGSPDLGVKSNEPDENNDITKRNEEDLDRKENNKQNQKEKMVLPSGIKV